MRAHMLVLLMMAGTAWAQQTGGSGVPGSQGGGGAPSGSAGGALTGSYPNPGLSPSAAIATFPNRFAEHRAAGRLNFAT